MSAEPLTPPVDRSGLRDSLAELCASQEEFHRFFSGLLDQFDALAAELLRRQQAWQAERRQAEDQFQKRAAALDRQRAELAAELAETRDEFSRAREELRRQREEFGAGGNEASPPQADPRLQEQLRRMEEERAVLDQQRVVLETELETVRNRAADMAETLAEQKRQMTDDRARRDAELKRMHRLMETLCQRQTQHHGVSEAHRPNGQPQPRQWSEPEQPVTAAAAPDDPVLDSVMAQFEMLQKDLARRRRNSCDCTP